MKKTVLLFTFFAIAPLYHAIVAMNSANQNIDHASIEKFLSWIEEQNRKSEKRVRRIKLRFSNLLPNAKAEEKGIKRHSL